MTMNWYDYDNQPDPADLVDQSGPWTDRDDYESSRADHEALFEQMQDAWAWPQPRPEDAATTDQLEAANLDPGGRDLDGLTALERASLEVGMADNAARRARDTWIELLPLPVGPVLRCTHCASNDNWIVREIGYELWCSSVEVGDDGIMRPYHDGWDDMTEEGTGTWLQCGRCDTAHQLPTLLEWS